MLTHAWLLCQRERGMSPPTLMKSFSLFLNLQSQLKKLSLILAYKLRPHCSFCPSLLHHTQSLALFPFYCSTSRYNTRLPLLSQNPKGHFFIHFFFFKHRDFLSLSLCLLIFHKGVLVQWIAIWWSSSHWFVSFLCLFQNHLILRKECLQMPSECFSHLGFSNICFFNGFYFQFSILRIWNFWSYLLLQYTKGYARIAFANSVTMETEN